MASHTPRLSTQARPNIQYFIYTIYSIHPPKWTRTSISISIFQMKYLSWGRPWSWRCECGRGFAARLAWLKNAPSPLWYDAALSWDRKHWRQNFAWAIYQDSHLPVAFFQLEMNIAPGSHLSPCVLQATKNVDLKTRACESLAEWKRRKSESWVSWKENRVGNRGTGGELMAEPLGLLR